MAPHDLDVIDFATRVERLCIFLIDKYIEERSRDGSDDLIALEKLRDDAADMISGNAKFSVSRTLDGLSNALSAGPASQT